MYESSKQLVGGAGVAVDLILEPYQNKYQSGKQLLGGVVQTEQILIQFGKCLCRYPDDGYDRVWQPASIDGTTTISTPLPVTDAQGLGIKPPSAVMQTAITPSNLSNLVIPYGYGSASTPIDCVYYLYFAEISATATASSRTFTVTIPNTPAVPISNINIYNFTGGVNKPVVYYWTNMTMTDTSAVTLALTTPPSVDPPLVNGAELFAKFPTLTLPTNADDGESLSHNCVVLNNFIPLVSELAICAVRFYCFFQNLTLRDSEPKILFPKYLSCVEFSSFE